MIIAKSVFFKSIAIVLTVSIFIVLKVRFVSLLHAGAFCNINQPPNVITSSKNELRLWFYSDKTDAYQGFNASYTSQWEQGTSDQNHDTKRIQEFANPRRNVFLQLKLLMLFTRPEVINRQKHEIRREFLRLELS